jgi:undecaprenyl phosphate-alpha-L-ara4FN deformylase
MGRIALKVDVDTWRGTREGLPALIDALKQARAGASFLFSLGPDHTGRAIFRVFRPGFLSKVSRTSVVEHYGVQTLLYGTLLPGPDIGVRGAELMRRVRAEGFEVGVHCWDHVTWQDHVLRRDAKFAFEQMRLARQRFEQVFGFAPRTHGAAGWQFNAHAARAQNQLGFGLASDTRGVHPFVPVNESGEPIGPMQLPTTLPTLDELIGMGGITINNVHEHLLALTAGAVSDQVYTLHAELEGMKLRPVFERLLTGWQAQGHSLVSLETMADSIGSEHLPKHLIVQAEVAGRSGVLATQGPPVVMGT